MTQALDIYLHWITGQGDYELYRKMIQIIQDVTIMGSKAKEHVFAMLDAFIRETKMEGVL
jgi:hypothetical protein